MIDAEKSDLFDVLAYIAFAKAPITREERVTTRRATIFAHYDSKLQEFLDFVLSQYVKEGVDKRSSASFWSSNITTLMMPSPRLVACQLFAKHLLVFSSICMSGADSAEPICQGQGRTSRVFVCGSRRN
jgi:hypothetical protein